MVREKRRKTGLFGKLYGTYIALIIVLIVIMFFNLRGILIKYENNQADNYVVSLIENAGKTDAALGSYLQTRCFSENATYGAGDGAAQSKAFYNTISQSELTLKKDLLNSDGNLCVYSVYADEKPFLSVAIEKIGSEKKLFGLLEIEEYEFEYAFIRNNNSESKSIALSENGTVKYSVVMPKDFELQINGAQIDISGFTDEDVIEDFEAFSSYDVVPMGVRCDFELCFEPEIVVLNNERNQVGINVDNNTYYAAADYSESEEAKEVANKIGDIGGIYKLWALFMTMDADGDLNGYYNVKKNCKIMPGSRLEELAYEWACGVDISFVSLHNYPSFNEITVDNYVLYNECFFSCDVYINETIPVVGFGNREQEYNNRLFFIYNEDTSVAAKGWYWVGQLDLTNR